MRNSKKTRLGDIISKANSVKCGNNDYPVLSMTMHDGIMLQSERFKKYPCTEQHIYDGRKKHHDMRMLCMFYAIEIRNARTHQTVDRCIKCCHNGCKYDQNVQFPAFRDIHFRNGSGKKRKTAESNPRKMKQCLWALLPDA